MTRIRPPSPFRLSGALLHRNALKYRAISNALSAAMSLRGSLRRKA
jgi:hypothetical protein